jgi:microcystin-dependent protein
MDPFLAQIKIFACNFAPNGWAFCNGQILPISQNTALFSLLGTTYGGNGTTNFALPNLQGCSPLSQGQGPGLSDYSLGQIGGSPTVTLITSQMTAHNHVAAANNGDGSLPNPTGNVWAGPGADRDLYWYSPYVSGQTVNMAPNILSLTGGGQPHNNLMPYLTLNYCIALSGVFPARN